MKNSFAIPNAIGLIPSFWGWGKGPIKEKWSFFFTYEGPNQIGCTINNNLDMK